MSGRPVSYRSDGIEPEMQGHLLVYRYDNGEKRWCPRLCWVKQGNFIYSEGKDRSDVSVVRCRIKLEGAKVSVDKKRIHKNQFIIASPRHGTFNFRASSAEEVESWCKAIENEIGGYAGAPPRKNRLRMRVLFDAKEDKAVPEPDEDEEYIDPDEEAVDIKGTEMEDDGED